MCFMICLCVTFERVVAQESIHYLLYSVWIFLLGILVQILTYSVCIFLLGILVQIVCSAPLFVHMPDMYLACWIMLQDMIGGVRYRVRCLTAQWCERCLLITESPKTPGHYRYLIWVLATCSRLLRACVMIGGNTHVFWPVTRGLHVWQEILFYHCILSVVQPCRVFQILHL